MLTRDRRDDGFSLIELVIVVAILGVVTAALTGIVFQYARVTNETSTRLNESTDQQLVAAYWQQDVSSLGLHDFVTGTVPARPSAWKRPEAAPLGVKPQCSEVPSGQDLVFGSAWNDYETGNAAPSASTTWTDAKQNTAIYSTKEVGTRAELWRTRCTVTADGSHVVKKSIRLARHLDLGTVSTPTPPVAACLNKSGAEISCGSHDPYPAKVTLTMTVKDKSKPVHASTGYTRVLIAQTRQG